MKKHKKILIVLLLAVCVILTGCSSTGTVELMQLPNGAIMETYSIPYAEAELRTAGITADESEQIKRLAKIRLDKLFTSYLTAYQARVNQSELYTSKQKEELINGITITNSIDNSQNIQISTSPSTIIEKYTKKIEYYIVYSNSTCFLEFKNANQIIDQEKTVITEKSLFTTTTKVVKDPVFDNIANTSISLGKEVITQMEEIVVAVLSGNVNDSEKLELAKQRWSAIKTAVGFNSASEYFTYRYYVPSARYKSNADKITKQYYSDVGYMYIHEWQVPANNSQDENPIQFEYWTTTASKAVWYGLATLGAVSVMLVVYLIAKKQEKQQAKKDIEIITKLDI